MFVKGFERVRGKHAERIFMLKITVICAIFGIVTAAVLAHAQNAYNGTHTFSNEGYEFRFITPDTLGASGFKDDVPILERGFVDDIPVEQGEIILRGGNLPEELPIKNTRILT